MNTEWNIVDPEVFDERHIEEFLRTLGDLFGYDIYKWETRPSKDPRFGVQLRVLGYKEKEQ